MTPQDDPFCSHTKLPDERKPEVFADEIATGLKTAGKSLEPQAEPYACAGPGGSTCDIYPALGCRPEVAECRYARMIEPLRGMSSFPRRVDGVWCWGEDLCTLESCVPQPRFAEDYN